MSIPTKVLFTASTLGSCCVGIPLLSSKQTPSKVDKSMKLDETAKSLGPELISDHKYSERKTIVKGECEVVFTVSDLDEFLKKQKEDKNDYVATSCKITNVKNEYISLPERWNVLFPKSVLDSNYSFKLGEKFDFYSETVPRNELNNGGGH